MLMSLWSTPISSVYGTIQIAVCMRTLTPQGDVEWCRLSKSRQREPCDVHNLTSPQVLKSTQGAAVHAISSKEWMALTCSDNEADKHQ